MKIIYKIVAIIYKTLAFKNNNIPYSRTILGIIFMIFVHIVLLGLMFNIPSHYIIPWNATDSKWTKWLKSTLYFLIPTILLLLIFTKKKLEMITVSNNQISIARKIMPIYFIFSILLLTILLVKHGIKLGTI